MKIKTKLHVLTTGILICLVIFIFACSSSTSDNSDNGDAPSTPSGFTIDSFENGTVKVSWLPVQNNDLKGYYVYWDTDPVTTSSNRNFVDTYNSTISGLDCDVTYYFAVTSVNNSSIESVISESKSGKCETSNDETPPAVPSGLTIEDSENGAIKIVWNPVNDDDLAGYYVYWRGGAKADTLTANRMLAEVTTATITGLDYDIFYYFGITSVDYSGNESALSSQVNGRPLNTTPPDPPQGVNITAENTDITKINIYWSENSEPDISHYNVYRSISPSDIEDKYLTSVTQENYIDVNVEIGVEYYYSITTVDKGDLESELSSIIYDKVLPSVDLISPIKFQYVNDHPTFKWNPVEGAVKYVLFLRTARIGGDIWQVELNKNTTEVPYSGNTNLISGNTYYWQVGAVSKSEINSESTVGTFVVNIEN